MSTSVTLLARQPIYNSQLNIVAYELLFRAGDENKAEFFDADLATSQVILNAFTELPVNDVLGGKPVYINFTRKFLDTPPPIDKRHVVVEILEDVNVDESMLNAVRDLKHAGYTIALDDYIFNPDHDQLLQMVDIVKLDVLKLGWSETQCQIKLMREHSLQFLAEKVETYEDFSQCKAMGFTLFQGYFLAKPQMLRGRKVDSNQQSVLRLFGVLQDPQVDFDDVVRVIGADPVLSFKLLRLVNSAMFGLNSAVDSVQRAILILGLSNVKSWVGLLAMTSHCEKT